MKTYFVALIVGCAAAGSAFAGIDSPPHAMQFDWPPVPPPHAMQFDWPPVPPPHALQFDSPRV